MALVRVRGIRQYMAAVHGERADAPVAAAGVAPLVVSPRAQVVASAPRTFARGFVTPVGVTSRFTTSS